MDLRDALATNVRRARHAKKLTQEELAERADLSSRYVGSVERAAVSVSLGVLARLAKALEVEASELIRITRRRRPS
jgi:transcriptional regulator with XRE-family HTH domain